MFDPLEKIERFGDSFIRYKDKDLNPISMEKYCELSQDREYKIIQQDTIGNCFLSTIWLGLNHGWGTEELYFETCVFEMPEHNNSEVLQRYDTKEHALTGHHAFLLWIKDKVEKGLNPRLELEKAQGYLE